MLEADAWRRHGAHANAMAARLAAHSPFPVVHPVEANGVFLQMNEAAYARLRKSGWFAWRVLDGSVRLMCSWATTKEGVDEITAALQAAA